MATNDVQMPKIGGLLETVELQGRVINMLAAYVNEMLAFYDRRCKNLEQSVFGAQPAPSFPTFEQWMETQQPKRTTDEGRPDFRDMAQDRRAAGVLGGSAGVSNLVPNFNRLTW